MTVGSNHKIPQYMTSFESTSWIGVVILFVYLLIRIPFSSASLFADPIGRVASKLERRKSIQKIMREISMSISGRCNVFALLLSLASATAATATTIHPLTPAHKKQISTAIGAQLKDSESARYRWLRPRKFGLYCAWVNAKNSYGAYSGFEPFMVLGGVGDGPKADGKFLIFSATLGAGRERSIVTDMCAKEGFDMGAPPAE